MNVLRNPSTTVFSLVLLPERLPIAETQSAMSGLQKLGIGVQSLIVNQTIPPEVIEGNPFLAARAALQEGYLQEIDARFSQIIRAQLPLFDHIQLPCRRCEKWARCCMATEMGPQPSNECIYSIFTDLNPER